MSSLRCHKVSFAYSDAVPLFREVDLHLTPGWIGLIGENGAGKTPLLRLPARELCPDEAHIRVEPDAARVASCPQTVEGMGPEIAAFAALRDAGACQIKGQLALVPDALLRWSTLSPGER